MLINFTKMHGLGNDFMVIDNTDGSITLDAGQITRLARRNFGVGFDQLLMVESSDTAGIDFRYVIYNADGSEVAQCGNGARCFARFVREKGLTSNNPIAVETRSGAMHLLINKDQTVRVDMGEPIFAPVNIPLKADKQQPYYCILGYEMGILSMGNPHCVIKVDDVQLDKAISDAPQIQHSHLLPEQANIGFMEVVNRHTIRLRVYERGTGETLACGSGACAAVVYGVERGWLDGEVVAHLTGGDALIEYAQGGHVFLSGAAEFVFEGQVEV
ncbi:Diaminopimelate epimerase [Bathymodiolus heckerae thiotrophic gill symbiont]|uniref:diaminopimelate epimerase n=1 Tax=Bathymodiolus heckerae thiotrophic gill symbiont TaxID=1052212 RepID=UPI0010B16895|nr:diaminopimelate epimerase [Bathymodiolus heckerae thiotrophic gill symbiont]SMN13089.1 Diaminopimelate epimerase [Bathymodiolus heckerae thiotrophic gill symbiont]